jgi:HAE1 family hydrophobic/amphiphilic exporter-1
MEEIRKKSKIFENIEINVNETDDMNSGAEIMTPFQLILKASDSKLAEQSAKKLIDYLKTIEGTTNIQNNIQPKKTEVSIEILKQNSSKFGVKSSDIARVIAMAYSGEIAISNFNKNGKEYDIVMRLSDDLRTNKDVINQLNVKNDKEELIALSSLVNINSKEIASVIKRYDRQKQVTVGSLSQGVSGQGPVWHREVRLRRYWRELNRNSALHLQREVYRHQRHQQRRRYGSGTLRSRRHTPLSSTEGLEYREAL